jgi:hypothetical protein
MRRPEEVPSSRSRRGVKVQLLVAATTWVAVLALTPLRAEEYPIGHVQVAYREVYDGKVDPLVHIARLECSGNLDCELTTLDLNWCLPSLAAGAENEKAYAIQMGKSSTKYDDLKVRSTIERGGRTGTFVAEEESEGGAKLTYRFEFTLRTTVGGMGGPLMDKVTGFSGAAVKNSVVAKKVVTWTLEPLKGEWSIFEPACKMMLPGVPIK